MSLNKTSVTTQFKKLRNRKQRVYCLTNCHILQFLHHMNVSALLTDDALLNVLLQKSSCYQLLLLIYITHSHGSARVFQRRRSKSMEKAKIRPLATPKLLNRSSQ